ncbi:MAG: hypothetical protein K2W92_02090 [Alphaproteobacteria bacterium]|nr:hypothetical protein [Alphaproteobacteria bacterium]
MSKTSLRESGRNCGEKGEKKRGEWGRLIEEWRQSGLSQRKFCTQAGVSYSSYKYWNSRLGQPKVKKSGQGYFVPVLVEEAENPSPLESKDHADSIRDGESPCLEILFEGGERIAIGRGFDVVTLRRVIDVMRGLHA